MNHIHILHVTIINISSNQTIYLVEESHEKTGSVLLNEHVGGLPGVIGVLEGVCKPFRIVVHLLRLLEVRKEPLELVHDALLFIILRVVEHKQALAELRAHK